MADDLAGSLARIREAAVRLEPFLRRTPTIHSHTFSESAGCRVFLKLENLQRTGAFKLRGAANRVLTLREDERARGLIAASAGNHAQGVALAAKQVGVPATIVMPVQTPLLKIRRTEGYGATIVLFGASWDEAQAHALELAAQSGAVVVHPFDDERVIEGQGTVGLEILADVPDVETVLVPVGGGGLIAGVALVLAALRPDVRLIGVQAEGAAPMVRSFAQRSTGVRVDEPNPHTLADGIRVGRFGTLTWDVVREHVHEMVTVSDAEITAAVVQAIEKSKVVAEPAGVVGMAALMSGRIAVHPEERVCCLVSGGNIDLTLLARVIESGLANTGYYHLLKLRMRDAAGQLERVVSVVATHGGNILDIQHYRAGWKVPVGYVDVEILMETRAPEEGAAIEAALTERGIEVTSNEAPG